MDGLDAKLIYEVARDALLVAFFVYTWSVGRNRATHAEIEEERKRRREDVDDLRTRLTRVEARLDDAPTGKALHEVALSISALAGEFKSHAARLDGLSEVVKRLEVITNRQEEYLLNMPRK